MGSAGGFAKVLAGGSGADSAVAGDGMLGSSWGRVIKRMLLVTRRLARQAAAEAKRRARAERRRAKRARRGAATLGVAIEARVDRTALHLAGVTKASMETHGDCLRIMDRAEKLVGERRIEHEKHPGGPERVRSEPSTAPKLSDRRVGSVHEHGMCL
jgi:hypothetical protein